MKYGIWLSWEERLTNLFLLVIWDGLFLAPPSPFTKHLRSEVIPTLLFITFLPGISLHLSLSNYVYRYHVHIMKDFSKLI